MGEFQYLASACLSWPVLGISLSHAIVIASACYGMLRKHTKTHQALDCSPLDVRSPDICLLPSFSWCLFKMKVKNLAKVRTHLNLREKTETYSGKFVKQWSHMACCFFYDYEDHRRVSWVFIWVSYSWLWLKITFITQGICGRLSKT